MKILIIIPTYNEKDNIDKIINEIFLQSIDNLEILIVDDNSADGTKEILDKLKSQNKINLIERSSKQGLASAYIEGFKYAIEHNFDFIIQMDADFSHNPKYLNEIISNLKTYDVVIASRNIEGGNTKGWSLFRNLISKCGSNYARLILNCPINDLTGGFNGWRREILNKINLDKIISKGYLFQVEMKYKAYKSKAKIIEIPIIFEQRKHGKSKMSLSIFFEALFNVIKIRFDKN